MELIAREMAPHKRVALVAYDNMKTPLLNWVMRRKEELKLHHLYATGTTGTMLGKKAQLPITCLFSGPMGGDQQLGALIGEMALFTAVARPVTAIAREPTQVMRLSRSVMRRVLAESPGSAEAVAAGPMPKHWRSSVARAASPGDPVFMNPEAAPSWAAAMIRTVPTRALRWTMNQTTATPRTPRM